MERIAPSSGTDGSFVVGGSNLDTDPGVTFSAGDGSGTGIFKQYIEVDRNTTDNTLGFFVTRNDNYTGNYALINNGNGLFINTGDAQGNNSQIDQRECIDGTATFSDDVLVGTSGIRFTDISDTGAIQLRGNTANSNESYSYLVSSENGDNKILLAKDGSVNFAGIATIAGGYTVLGEGYSYFKSKSTGMRTSNTSSAILNANDDQTILFKANGEAHFDGHVEFGDPVLNTADGRH